MEEVAQVYSRALFDVATEHGKLDRIRDELTTFVDALDRNRELAIFCFSPYFSTTEKKEGLEQAIDDADPEFVNFLELLVDKHRMPLLFRIRRQYEELWDAANKRLPVEVTSAVALDSATVSDLGRRVREQTGMEVELTSNVEPDILGGIMLRVGNSILDASIRHRLEVLRREVAKAT